MKRFCLILVVLTAWGCRMESSPRRLPYPTLDPAQPFTGAALPASGTEAGFESGADLRAASSFEESLTSYTSSVEPTQGAPVEAVQKVPVAGFVARLPHRFDDWTWAAGARRSLILHTTAGRPDALIYAEATSDLAERWPSAEVNRFLRTVAPPLASRWVDQLLPEPPGLVSRLAKETDLKRSEVRQALRRLSTATLGRGLGLRGSEDTFTGWKWVGRNDQDVRFRLGRWSGRWAPTSEPDEAVRRVVQVLAASSDRFAELERSFDEPRARTPPNAAYMVLGSARLETGLGVHLAILCRQQPSCPVAADLAVFLASLSPDPGDSTTLERETTSSQMRELIQQAGIELQLESEAIDLEDLAAATRAQQSAEETSAQEGS